MTDIHASLINLLRQTVGTANVLTDGDLSGYEQDWRKRARGKALAVVRPNSAQQVASVVKACAAAQVSIVPQFLMLVARKLS
jgi:FAD/FMN-containing dehydrogenase